MADRLTKNIKVIFQIPDTYVMSDYEEKKLLKILQEAKSLADARLYRILGCSASCITELFL